MQPLMQGCLGRCVECPLFVHLAYQCSFLFVYFVGLYAGHTYIHLISFEISLLACLCTFYISPPHALDTSPTYTSKEALPVASNSRLITILHTSEQATELCDKLQSPTCTFAISIATTTSVVASRACSHYVRARITCVLLRKWRLTFS